METEDDNGDTPFVYAFRGLHSSLMEVLHTAGCQTEIAKMSLALATKDTAFVRLCHRLDIPVENEDWNSGDVDEVRLLLEELQLDPFEGQYGRHGFDDSPFMYVAQEGSPAVLGWGIQMQAARSCRALRRTATRVHRSRSSLCRATPGDTFPMAVNRPVPRRASVPPPEAFCR